ncbi:polysaccharide export protein [Altererythrobacter confluentis]|uniref:Polysaccharide export protein n=1 Tax=Allopontixanthobacter confluentis TaxID=1849021 RepID=A0A6L7GF97_9SPHN|nr:polysaccharide biosynthesis/export family protein [Allopontixanthobacter confluentis]MXP13321.1 polysaccharide export protein [Allopontixanthobacter confluentis]
MQIFRIAILAIAGISLAACASSPKPIATAPGIQLVDLDALPSPEGDGGAIVRSQDTLRVSVLGFADLSRELKVDATGAFQFPLIGLIQADGRTPIAISREIAQRLDGRFVVNPEVTVDLMEQPGRVITIGGEVSRPGRYPVTGSMTLLEVVATGGGATDTAQLDDVLIFRKAEGERYIGVYNLGAIQRGNYADPVVFAGDIVQVGNSPTLKRIQMLTALSPLLTTPIILLERLLR